MSETSKVGTPFYLSPELWLENCELTYSYKSDIWALGVILYELCIFQKPFISDTIEGLKEKIQSLTLSHPITKVSPDLQVLIQTLLRKCPDTRPSIEDLLKFRSIR